MREATTGDIIAALELGHCDDIIDDYHGGTTWRAWYLEDGREVYCNGDDYTDWMARG